ncbi:VOC family protein [Nocardioides marmoraquaticus]
MVDVERVTGIGGIFFTADDPERLTAWYAEHLGVDAPPESYEESSWRQTAGATVLAPMPIGSDYFGHAAQQWAINFRVRDLDAMVAQLRARGVEVSVHAKSYPNGRFGDLEDPEGNPIQLWQPAGPDA